MNLAVNALSEIWSWASHIVFLLAWILVLFTTPWKILLDNLVSHGFLGVCVLLIALWHITTTEFPGLSYHFVGATLLTLMFRWQLAFVGMNLVLLAMTLSGQIEWYNFTISAIILALVPILVSYSLFRLADSKLPNHFFIYIFVNAFIGAGLAVLFIILATAGLLFISESYTYTQLTNNYLLFLPLMMFPEAFITGMLITLFVIYYPQWVITFDDLKYLRRQ